MIMIFLQLKTIYISFLNQRMVLIDHSPFLSYTWENKNWE